MQELESLVNAAKTGDLSAYGTMVQRFQDMGVGYAYSILGDFHLAEDAAQEAFITAYQNLSQLREPAAFPGWFRQIIKTHCARFTRGKRVETLPLEAVAEMPSQEKSPSEAAEEQELKDNVSAAIAALPEKERTVTTLFYINGYSQKEIGAFLGIAVKTVKNHLYAARSRLRERMLTMVQDTLHENRPSRDQKFVEEVRDLTEKLRIGQKDYLPMIFGTVKESIKQTEALEKLDEPYIGLVDNLDKENCVYTLRRAENALWIALILPSNWEKRFTIFEASLPNLMTWFMQQAGYQYLYAEIREKAPRFPTVTNDLLPIFLKNGFKPEYRMLMKRHGKLPIPDALPLPEGFTQEGYAEKNFDEIAAFVSDVYTRENVGYDLDAAKKWIGQDTKNEIFVRTAKLLRDGKGTLVGAGWCGSGDAPDIGELVVSQEYQGKGLGTYLLNEAIRFLAERYPGKDIYLGTCREWKKALNLYEKYDFVPERFWTWLNLNKRRSG
ncbi:GNAT family N-acetyltransferase [Candidatus Poribacteria bacterium]|nr:GNAT family N-acetyltransferase [Candidatus Poribacteria bacterium]